MMNPMNPMNPMNLNKYIDGKQSIIYDYGSRVYRTNSEKSDYDYIVVLLNNDGITSQEIRDENINIHFMNEIDFQAGLNNHKINILECYFQNKHHFKFNLNLKLLREEISGKSSNSFVKAKKKIEVEKEYYLGWKSLFHSLRIVNFGIQIASQGKIYDYSQSNNYWFDILSMNCYNWEALRIKYKPIYNSLCTDLRKLAPLQ